MKKFQIIYSILKHKKDKGLCKIENDRIKEKCKCGFNERNSCGPRVNRPQHTI